MKKIYGRKYNLISGILVRDKKKDSDGMGKQRKSLYKRLGKSKTKLIKA